MKRSLVLTFVSLGLFACDLEDKSLGDTGADQDSIGDDASATAGDDDSATSQGSGNDGLDCTAIGCDSGIFLTLSGELADGAYAVRVFDANTRVQLQECAFDKAGEIGANACLAHVLGDDIEVLLDVAEQAITVEVSIDGQTVGSTDVELEYEVFQPNGPDCEPTCTQARLALALAEPMASCVDLGEQFNAEAEAVRSCEVPGDCGQVLQGFSCGCTNDWVARLDADPASLISLQAQGVELECSWAQWDGSCDCPETDGFDCIDNICTWNYL